MALRGNLKDFSLPDVFQLVTLSGKTGILRIKRADDAEGSVWFRDGDVFFAQSNWQREPLGERMASAGKITPSALARVLDLQRSEPAGARRLGQLLVDEGYITGKVLEAFVQEQIQDTIFDLFRWDEGAFDFEPLGDVPAEEDIGLRVSIENIVMEGSRRLEEWNRIKKKIPSVDIVFKMATAPGEGTFEISLKPIEWNLLLLVDGTRSVDELATGTSRTDFEVSRVLYGLFSAGLLEVASDEEVERLRGERAKLEERAAALRRAAAEAAAPAPPEPTAAATEAVEEPVEPEVPEFLSGAQSSATAEDMAAFQEMMGAVLQPPEAPPKAPAEAAGLVVEEPEAPLAKASLEVPVEAPVVEAPAEPAPELVLEPAGEEVPEPPGEEVTEYFTPEIAVAEPMSVMEPQVAEVAEAPGEIPGLVHEPEAAPTEDLLAPLDERMSAAPAAPLAEEAATTETPHEERELTIAELEALATAPELEVITPGEDLAKTAGAAGAPAEEEVPEEEVPEEEVPEEDLSALLASLHEETPLEEQELEPEPEPPAQLAEPGGGAPAEVISTDAFLSDFDEPVGGSLSGGLGDELTALTGGGRARQAGPTIRTNTSYEPAAVPHRDHMVDRDLVMKVIDGIKNL